MTNRVAELESALAEAKAAEVQVQSVAAAQAEVAAAEDRRRQSVASEIATTEAGIAHLEAKIAERRTHIERLKARL